MSSSENTSCLLYNAQIATMTVGANPYGMLANAAIAVEGGLIKWIGSSHSIPAQYCANKIEIDCQGQLITPGLIDCHTHLVHAGNRADEFEQRLNGASYAEIAKSGGGILSTVAATRAASFETLFTQASARLQQFMDQGVTTVEIKSGYGLNLPDEIKMLEVARGLNDKLALNILTTFLGAHAMPSEFNGDKDAYIDFVCDEVLPVVADRQLADAVDGFCENIAFSVEQISRVFDAAQDLELPIKLHAEQLSDSKGALMAANRGALSVDHIEYLQADDVSALAKNNTTAVLLPGAFYFLKETQLPPVAALREQRVPIAIASDSNPGSSPVDSILLMLNMACTLFSLTPEESLAGVTRNASLALGIDHQVGTLEIGKFADLVLWQLSNPAELSYRIGSNPISKVMYRGEFR